MLYIWKGMQSYYALILYGNANNMTSFSLYIFQTETKEKIVSVVTSTKKKLNSAKKTYLQQYLPHQQVNPILRLHYVRNQSVSQHSYLIYFTRLTKFGTHFAKPVWLQFPTTSICLQLKDISFWCGLVLEWG